MATAGFSFAITCAGVSFVTTSGVSRVITWIGSFFVACSRSANWSLGGANVCERPVLEIVRSAVIVKLRQTGLRTSARYAVNPHSQQEIFLLLKELAEEKPSAEERPGATSHYLIEISPGSAE